MMGSWYVLLVRGRALLICRYVLLIRGYVLLIAGVKHQSYGC